MDWFFRAFDLFNQTAQKLAGYLPQSGEDVMQLFKQLSVIAANLNFWVANNIGLNLQSLLATFGRVIVLWFTFLIDLLKNLVNRL